MDLRVGFSLTYLVVGSTIRARIKIEDRSQALVQQVCRCPLLQFRRSLTPI
jgi:hypothetical protein